GRLDGDVSSTGPCLDRWMSWRQGGWFERSSVTQSATATSLVCRVTGQRQQLVGNRPAPRGFLRYRAALIRATTEQDRLLQETETGGNRCPESRFGECRARASE